MFLGNFPAMLLFVNLNGFASDSQTILLTNDDGIKAPGIQAMHSALIRIGNVIVAAPASNQSATGHGLSVTAFQ